ncbi:hypothetical protein SCB49_01697 [unidentified eubacterium SCB49]|nr:hypothetical protein SCB49_01697 [unidentified eubacterium SCB49]
MLSKVVFNNSKIGWFKINKRELNRNFNFLGVEAHALNENEYINNYKALDASSLKMDEVYSGVSLYKVCIYSICNDLMLFKNEINLDLHKEVIFKWYSVAKKMIDNLTVLFNTHTFSLVVVINGHSLLDACLLSFAKKKNVPFLSLEGTSNSKKNVWDAITGKVITYNLSRKYFKDYQNKIKKEEVVTYISNFKNTIFDYKKEEHLSNEINTEVPFNTPFVLFLGQVYTDAAQLFSLKDDFDSPISVIETVIDTCKKLRMPLLIKLHPKENSGISPVIAKPYNLPTYKRVKKYENEHVFIDYQNTYNTFNLIAHSQAVITVNSQAGLEACIYDKPVLTYKNSFYSKTPFTYDYQDKKTLESQLVFVLNNKILNNRDLEAAQQFFFIFFEKYCIENTTRGFLRKVLEVGSFNLLVKFKFLALQAKEALRK